jgi:hypothetical protein
MPTQSNDPHRPLLEPWMGGKLNEQRKALSKVIIDARRAQQEARKTNHPIVGFRPEYQVKSGE